MDSSKQDEAQDSSPQSATTSSTLLSIPASSYLTVPSTRPASKLPSLPGPVAFAEDGRDLTLYSSPEDISDSVPDISSRFTTPPVQPSSPNSYIRRRSRSRSPAQREFMSVYSASSVDTETSTYSNPPARPYQVPSFQNMSRRISPVCSWFPVRIGQLIVVRRKRIK